MSGAGFVTRRETNERVRPQHIVQAEIELPAARDNSVAVRAGGDGIDRLPRRPAQLEET
jgi:hypothetical protein